MKKLIQVRKELKKLFNEAKNLKPRLRLKAKGMDEIIEREIVRARTKAERLEEAVKEDVAWSIRKIKQHISSKKRRK